MKYELLQVLSETIAVSADERIINQILKKEYEQYGYQIVYDKLGSIFVCKPSHKPNAKKVMITSSLDEIGYMITQIEEDGKVRLIGLETITPSLLAHQLVTVKTRSGKEYDGLALYPKVNLNETDAIAYKEEDIYIDMGVVSKQEVMDMGIHIGDSVVVKSSYQTWKHNMSGKALDTRIGLYVGIQILEYLKEKTLDFDLYIGGIAQAKVGYRGAQTAAYAIQPDMAIILQGEQDERSGVLLKYFDKTMLPNRNLLQDIEAVWQKKNIAYHLYQSLSGSDGAFIHKAIQGIPSVEIGIPIQNIKTFQMLANVDDVEALQHALLQFVLSLNEDNIISYSVI